MRIDWATAEGGRRSPRRVAILLVLLATAAAIPGARAAAGPKVIVYGDSLVYEAEPYIRRLVRDVARVEAKVLGAPGAAPCDVLRHMLWDAGRYRPDAVVIAFSGNALTPCMRDERGRALRGEAWFAKYRTDTIRALQIFEPTGARVWLATAPIGFMAERQGDHSVHRLAAMYHTLAARLPYVRVAEAARGVLRDGRWTLTLPCLSREPCTGFVESDGRRANQVRSHDGVHFCPVPYPKLGRCPVHASGALRYALGMVYPALSEQGLLDPVRFSKSIGSGWRP